MFYKKKVSISGLFILLLFLVNALILKVSFINGQDWHWSLLFTLPLLLIAVCFNKVRKFHTIKTTNDEKEY